MNIDNNYRFKQKDLYTIVMGNNEQASIKKVKSWLSKVISKTSRDDTIFPSAPYRVTFTLVQCLLELRSEVTDSTIDIDLYDKVTLKKIALTFIDGINVCGLGYSPLWLLAILNEVTEGKSNHLQIIQEELKKYGLLEEEDYDSIIILLENLYKKDIFDTTIFNHQTIGRIKDDLIYLMSYDKIIIEKNQKKLTDLWDRMHKICKYENFSVNKMSGIISLDILRKLEENGIPATETTLVTLIDNFDGIIVKAIEASISEFADKGRKFYLYKNIKPFIDYYLLEG